jgi:hypothetical protein
MGVRAVVWARMGGSLSWVFMAAGCGQLAFVRKGLDTGQAYSRFQTATRDGGEKGG